MLMTHHALTALRTAVNEQVNWTGANSGPAGDEIQLTDKWDDVLNKYGLDSLDVIEMVMSMEEGLRVSIPYRDAVGLYGGSPATVEEMLTLLLESAND